MRYLLLVALLVLANAAFSQQSTTGGRVSIDVTPTPGSPTYGIQDALNRVPAGGPQWGTNVTGALIRLAPGDYYCTNALFYSNTFPYSIKLQGSGLLNTRIIYAGLGTTTNLLKFCGTSANGGLGLPGHVEVEDITFMSLTNMQAALLIITNSSYESVVRCNFTGYQVTTNNLDGPAVSISVVPTDLNQFPGTLGLLIGQGNDHMTVVKDCFFANLACGVDVYGDHLYAENIKSAYIGAKGDLTYGTAWANTSPYFLGPLVLLHGGLRNQIFNIHLYICNTGVMQDSTGGCSIYNFEVETAAHAMAQFNPAGGAPFHVFAQNGVIQDDGGAPDGRYAVTHSPYAISSTTLLDVRYQIGTKLGTSFHLNGGGNQATNFGRFAAMTNLCAQPAAGFTPDFRVQNETASTNNGANTAVVFAAATLPSAYGGDMTYHEVLVHKTTGNDGAIILPAPYVTNISGVFRCTNNTLLEFRIWPGILTNVFSRPIN